MSQLRKDPITSRWVIVEVDNPKKAESYVPEPVKRSTKTCPFCPGNESMTPPEIEVFGRKHGSKDPSNWLVRIVPNKFPALRIEESHERYGIGLYEKLGGFGAHEVIIENPNHDKEIADLPVDHVELIFQAYRERILDLRKDERFKYVIIFKNYGGTAGASLEHPHSQLIALPIVPSRVQDELKGSQRHSNYTDRCIWCDMISQDKTDKMLTICENEHFMAMAPFVSRFPFEMWVMPKEHSAAFDTISDSQLPALAGLFKEVLTRLRKTLQNPSYNWMLHTLPLHSGDLESYHWHIQIIPRLTRVAGFELGTGFYVNPTPAELAASSLKNCNIP